jgi:hypothetical protein
MYTYCEAVYRELPGLDCSLERKQAYQQGLFPVQFVETDYLGGPFILRKGKSLRPLFPDQSRV